MREKYHKTEKIHEALLSALPSANRTPCNCTHQIWLVFFYQFLVGLHMTLLVSCPCTHWQHHCRGSRWNKTSFSEKGLRNHPNKKPRSCQPSEYNALQVISRLETHGCVKKDEKRPVQKERFVSTANERSQSLEFGSGKQTKPFILFIQTSFSIN